MGRSFAKGLVAALALPSALLGCKMIAGVDFDRATLAEFEGGTDPKGVDDTQPGTLPDGGPISSDCTPDPNAVTCAGRCNATKDNCGSDRQCSSDCGQGSTCKDGKCECAPAAQWCNNRCGDTRNNCNQPINCGGCDGGLTCTDNACGCVPEPKATTCGSKGCGTATNNCGQLVACGNNGTCATAAAICMADGTCCTDNGAACNGRCGGVTVDNNCGQKVGCPAGCPASQVCIGTSCCIPDPINVTCAGVQCGPKTNNCGQTVTCPNTCASPNTCGGGGAGANGCGCTPNDPCANRCNGTTTNSCGQAVNCNTSCWEICPCAGGFCTAGGYCNCNQGPCL